MSPQKHYFDEPVVSVNVSRVRFPKICPVCGVQASILSQIVLSSGGTRWDPSFRAPSRVMKQFPQVKPRVLRIFVCEDHDYSDDGDGEYRYKSFCIIVDGLAMVFFFFGLLFLGDAFSRGRPLPFWSVAFSALFAISLFFTWIAFRPNSLQRAVKIVGFDSGMQNVLLAFKDKSYQEAIIQENPMTSELVSWIVKPDS